MKNVTNKIVIEDNFGDFTKPEKENVRLANLVIGGKKDSAYLILPCLNNLKGKRIQRLTVEFEKQVELETPESINVSKWRKGVELARKALNDNPDFHPSMQDGMKDFILMSLLGLSHRTEPEDIEKFNELYERYNGEITDFINKYDNWYRADGESSDREYNPILDISKKFSDIEDQEMLQAVIKKVMDEQQILSDQEYSDEIIGQYLEETKSKVKEHSGGKKRWG